MKMLHSAARGDSEGAGPEVNISSVSFQSLDFTSVFFKHPVTEDSFAAYLEGMHV